MPQEPKKRHSRQRQGKRRASIKYTSPKGIICPNCGSIILPHSICKNCGFYKGKEVIHIQTAREKKEKKEKKEKERENK